MTATALDSADLPRHLHARAEMRQVFSDEDAHRLLSRDRGGARARAGRGSASFREKAAREIVEQVPDREHRPRPPQAADRAHRLSDPRRGAADRRRCAPTGSANGATGAPPRRTSPTPRPSCRSAPRSTWSSRTWRRSRPRSPTCRGAIATRRWPAAATCSRRCRSPSASRRAALLAAMQRHRERLAQLRPRVLVGEFGGAVGTLASLGADGLKVQAALMARARPRPAGDRLAHGARPHRRGRLLPRPRHRHARQDLDGREAPDADRGRRGLRAVPRGRAARRAPCRRSATRSRASTSTPPPRWCARTWPRCSKPRSPTTSARPARGRSSGSRCRKSSCSSSGALAQTRLLVAGLEVDAARMRANLDLTLGMIVSEAVMMGLGPHLGRQRAHDLVYDICRKVAATGEPLVDLLARDAEIAPASDASASSNRCAIRRTISGLPGEMVDQVLALESGKAGRARR